MLQTPSGLTVVIIFSCHVWTLNALSLEASLCAVSTFPLKSRRMQCQCCTYIALHSTTVFLGVLSPPSAQENWRLETGLRVFAVHQAYVIRIHHCCVVILVPCVPRHLSTIESIILMSPSQKTSMIIAYMSRGCRTH
jgi:hypothetical protein